MGLTDEQYQQLLRNGRQQGQRPLQATKAKPAKSRKAQGFDVFYGLLKAHGLPLPELEYVFHDTRKFKADYAWPRQKLIVERQGGLWAAENSRAKKAHTEPMAILRDYEKNNLAQLAGFVYLQFTPQQLDSGDALQVLRIILAERTPRP